MRRACQNIMVSVIIPMYNNEDTIGYAIESVLNQDYDNYEILVIDDGSTDNSIDAATKALLGCTKCCVLFHENGRNKGVSATRNVGIKSASGELLAFLDADDLWESNKLSACVEPFMQYPSIVMVYHSAKVFTVDNATMKAHGVYGSGRAGYRKVSYPDIYKNSFVAPTSSVVIKRQVLDKCGLFYENWKYGEDGLLWYSVLQHGDVYYYEKVLSKYRIHENQWNAIANEELKVYRRVKFYIHFASICDIRVQSATVRCITAHGARIVLRWALSSDCNPLAHMIKLYKLVLSAGYRKVYLSISLFRVVMEELIIHYGRRVIGLFWEKKSIEDMRSRRRV
mgnify:CR=1 FL=1